MICAAYGKFEQLIGKIKFMGICLVIKIRRRQAQKDLAILTHKSNNWKIQTWVPKPQWEEKP